MELALELQIHSQQEGIPDRQDFERWISTALQDYKTQAEVVVRIVDEQESEQLNSAYRQRSGATNVLSFPFEAPPQMEMDLLGDMVICAPVIAREAREQGKSLESHWAHMAVHSSLHLLGFDHQDEQEAVEMESLEKNILARMGYANPYE